MPERTLRLTGPRVALRTARRGDAEALHAIRSEPGVRRWWLAPDPVEVIAAELSGGSDGEVVLVVEVGDEVAGAIQFWEEDDPQYRHATIDLYLGERHRGQGLGPEAVAVLAAYLVDVRGHHRLTIDPAVDNEAAIRAYAKVGFRPVGVLRRYERGEDGRWHDGLLMDLLAEDLVRQNG
ncbi:MAG TPA: GNAT family protein [Mycobacteriales bacterium]|nr:GNAT family protein [Mycobacteriales bacterium]